MASVEKMAEAEIWSVAETEAGTGALLKPLGEEVVVPVFLAPHEVQALLSGLDRGKGPACAERPTTGGLFLAALKAAGLTLERAEIWDLRKDTFYGRVVLGRAGGEGPLALNARPADALTLAALAGSPLFVSRKVITRAGIPLGVFTGGAPRGGRGMWTRMGGEAA
ncbi:MAG: bifunctional nuclease family protein [Treponematales bacterium]